MSMEFQIGACKETDDSVGCFDFLVNYSPLGGESRKDFLFCKGAIEN